MTFGQCLQALNFDVAYGEDTHMNLVELNFDLGIGENLQASRGYGQDC